MFYFKNKSQFRRILISCQSLAIHFVIIIDCQIMKVINSFFNSCIDKFVTSSRYEFVTTFTFHFVNNIDFLTWSSMRFRWIFKIAVFRWTIFFWKIFRIRIFVAIFQLFNTNSIRVRIKFIANYFIFEFSFDVMIAFIFSYRVFNAHASEHQCCLE